MFLFRDPLRTEKSEPLDPIQVELERRILFAPPGHLGPFPTYEQIRAELAVRGVVSARALTSAETGFGPPVRVVVVHDLDGGVDRIVRAGTALQPPPEGAEAEQFRPLGEPDFDAGNVECGRKDTTGGVLRNSAATTVEIVEVSVAAESPSEADFPGAPSLIVKSGTSPQSQQKLQRPRRQPKSNSDSIFETGSKPKTKPKASARAKARAKPKRDRKKTISPDERALAELCFFMAQALDCPFNMKADLNPGHLDRLDVEGRIAFCMKIVGILRAYIRSRRIARGMPESWWPDVWGWVRESDPWTNLKEHVHLVFYAPEDERRRMVKSMEEKRKDPEAKKWCENAKFARIHPWEHWTGSKFKSALGYFVKMANPQDYSHDSTIWYKKSGFIAGPRIKFSPFLLDPDRVEAHRIDVQALTQLRDNDRAIMRRSGSEPAKNPRSLLRAATAPTPEPADVQAEAVPAEIPATATPAVPAPIIVPAAAVEPEPIEPAICSGSGSAGPVHREQGHRHGMCLVEIETRPAMPAAIEPAPVPRESASVDAAPVTAHAGAVELVEGVTPAIPPPAPPLFVTEPGTAIEAAIVPDIPGEAVAPAQAEPASAFSSPRAVLASLAGLRRAVARTATAGVGWIASRFGARPPLSPTSAVRRPRAPLFDAASLISAGAFLGAPDIQSDAW